MISNQKDGRGIITMGSSWERHPRNILFMHKRDFEIAGKIHKRIRYENLYYPKKLEDYDSTFYFHDVLKDSISEFKHILDESESDFDIYLEDSSVWANELFGRYIDHLIKRGELDGGYGEMGWVNNALFVIFFEYYMCTTIQREKYSGRLEKIENYFLDVSEFIKETKNYDWVRCFIPRIEDFLDEESTTPEIVEIFGSIFGFEIEWEEI